MGDGLLSNLAIQVDNLCHQYKQQNTPSIFIPTWQVNEGQQIFLHGDSGSGKSTLLNLLSGVLPATSGSIQILGQELTSMSNAQRDAFRAQNIGVVFQTFNLIPYLSVLDNIKLAVYLAKGKQSNLVPRVKQLINDLHLDKEIIHHSVNQLSIGQQQRVAIVRALINRPKLLLVDEPTSSLDSSARDAFLNILVKTSQQMETSMVFVSHDKSIEGYFTDSVEIASLYPEGI